MHWLSQLVIVAALLGALSSSADFLAPPPGAAGESGSSVALAKGARRWINEWTMERDTLDGQNIVRFTEQGSGRYSPFDREVRWHSETIWTTANHFLPLTSERTITDTQGRVLFREKKSFDFRRGKVEIQTESAGARAPSRESISIPPDTLTVDGIAGALRSLGFEQEKPATFHLLSNEPKLYEMSAPVRGRERIRTPAGEFDCYRVELVPSLGILGLFRFAAPKAYFWFTVAPPHMWVRYQGPENGRGTPEIVLELASFKRSTE